MRKSMRLGLNSLRGARFCYLLVDEKFLLKFSPDKKSSNHFFISLASGCAMLPTFSPSERYKN